MRYYLNNLWNHYSWWPKFKSQIWYSATISPCNRLRKWKSNKTHLCWRINIFMAFSSIHQCVMMAARYNIPMNAEHTESTGATAVGASIKGSSPPWYRVKLSLSRCLCTKTWHGRTSCGTPLPRPSSQQPIAIRAAGEPAAWCIRNRHSCDLSAIGLWISPHFCLMNVSWGQFPVYISNSNYPPHILPSTPQHSTAFTPTPPRSVIMSESSSVSPDVFNKP